MFQPGSQAGQHGPLCSERRFKSLAGTVQTGECVSTLFIAPNICQYEVRQNWSRTGSSKLHSYGTQSLLQCSMRLDKQQDNCSSTDSTGLHFLHILGHLIYNTNRNLSSCTLTQKNRKRKPCMFLTWLSKCCFWHVHNPSSSIKTFNFPAFFYK